MLSWPAGTRLYALSAMHKVVDFETAALNMYALWLAAAAWATAELQPEAVEVLDSLRGNLFRSLSDLFSYPFLAPDHRGQLHLKA